MPRPTSQRRPPHPVLLGIALSMAGCGVRPVSPPPSGPGLGVTVSPGVPPPAVLDAPGDPGHLPGRFAVADGGAEAVGWRLTVVDRGRPLVGQRTLVIDGRTWRADCSGLVIGLFAASGIDLLADGPLTPGENGVSILHRYVEARGGLHRGPPRPGDLAFFHDTYDADGDGRRNDPLTHVALVESLDGDGTVVLLHHVGGRVRRGRMNLDSPDLHRSATTGRVLNDYLRRGRGPRLTAQLFAGYGVILP